MARKATAETLEPQVTGLYNELGYQVFVGGHQVYFALNHIHDTHAFADPNGDEAVPLLQLREFCEKMCAAEAEDRGLKCNGVQYEDWK